MWFAVIAGPKCDFLVILNKAIFAGEISDRFRSDIFVLGHQIYLYTLIVCVQN